ncbi:MAG: hypothetical protein LBC59_10005 [Chitinispirillales bacterium]|jgi:hypothetical protein|nr:hypothetical protein [Chitinispirillales bacterium]
MNSRIISKLVRTLLLAAVTAFISVGCGGGGGGENPANNNTPSNNNNGGSSTSLVCGNDEAWVEDGRCTSERRGLVFKSNGDYIKLDRNDNGVWVVSDESEGRTWRTDGNKIIWTRNGRESSTQGEILSNGSWTLHEDGKLYTFKKCSGLTIEW